MSGPFCATKIRLPEAAHILSGQAGLILVNKQVRAPRECVLWHSETQLERSTYISKQQWPHCAITAMCLKCITLQFRKMQKGVQWRQARVFTGIDHVYYKDYYPVTAEVYGMYPIREPDQANLAPIRVGRLRCMAEREIGHFEVTLRDQRLTDIKRTKIQEWKARVHDHV